jgi:hypothetical protein
MEFLSHGFKYVFPPAKGSLARGLPTAAAAEPLKSRFLDDGDPPEVWPYVEGKVRGISLVPLYKGAPKAALRDPKVLRCSCALRCNSRRENAERNLAIELLGKEINA